MAWRSPPAYFITQPSMKARFGDLKILPYKEGSGHLSSVHAAGHRPQNLILSISSRVMLSPVRSYSRVVWDDSCAAMARASSSEPPLER